MKRFSVGPGRIAVDRCPAHGAWLDRGELQGLEATARGDPPPAPGQPPPRRRWTCGSCGEQVEFEFTHCWKCQAEAPEPVRSLVGPRASAPVHALPPNTAPLQARPPGSSRPPAPPARSTRLGWLAWVLVVGLPFAGSIVLGVRIIRHPLGGYLGWMLLLIVGVLFVLGVAVLWYYASRRHTAADSTRMMFWIFRRWF